MKDKSDLQIEQDEDELVIIYKSVLAYFLRYFLNITQTELAGGSEVSFSMICKTEAGKRTSKGINLRRITLKLGLTREDFYHIIENTSIMEELVSRILQDQPFDYQKINQAMMQCISDAELAFSSMQILVSHQRYRHALYFLNQNIQSLLFALFIKTHQVTSPLVENNFYLLRTIDRAKAKEQTYFLGLLCQKLHERELTKEDFNHLILSSLKLRKWLKLKLKESMAPPPKLKYNRPKYSLRKKILKWKESTANQ